MWDSLSALDGKIDVVLTGVRTGECPEIADIYCTFDATTHINGCQINSERGLFPV
jgi:hypothetical protein